MIRYTPEVYAFINTCKCMLQPSISLVIIQILNYSCIKFVGHPLYKTNILEYTEGILDVYWTRTATRSQGTRQHIMQDWIESRAQDGFCSISLEAGLQDKWRYTGWILGAFWTSTSGILLRFSGALRRLGKVCGFRTLRPASAGKCSAVSYRFVPSIRLELCKTFKDEMICCVDRRYLNQDPPTRPRWKTFRLYW